MSAERVVSCLAVVACGLDHLPDKHICPFPLFAWRHAFIYVTALRGI